MHGTSTVRHVGSSPILSIVLPHTTAAMGDTPWLRNALRFALHATASTEAPWPADSVRTTEGKLVDPDDPGKDPRFRALVEAILFSRRFLKTYNVVLLGVLLVFTAWHWTEVLVLRRRTRRITTLATRDDDAAEAWSSSSSTIGGVSPHRPAKPTEASPLLASRTPQRKPPGLWKPYYVAKSLLQYQPRPIPVINKTLPTNATSLFVLGWLALIAFYNLYRMPLSFMYLFVFADRCGIIFIVNLPLLYLLAAKNQPIKWLTGYSYEALNIFHRRVGEVMCLEAFLHFVGMFAVWFGMLRHLGFTLEKFIFNRVVLLGLAAFISYEVIYFTSLGSFRKRWYELFLALHVVLQIAGLVFLWFHHYTSRPYVGISLAIFLIDRVVYRMWLKSSTHPATLTILDDDETVLVSANWDVATKQIGVPANMRNGWSPNQHIFISIPDLGRTHALQTHPFTIFSAAPTPPSSSTNDNSKHAWFTLLIRPQSSNSFTHSLLTYARTNPSTNIRLDGPYGSPHALSLLSSSHTAILIAGGSGIAVAYPLLYALLSPTSDPETPAVIRKVKLLWITHSPTHKLWLPDSKLRELEEWGLDVLIPPPTALARRPDVRDVLRGWVGEEEGRTGVVVSGPEGLVRDVRNVCGRMVAAGVDVSVGVEKFGW
jgi:NAD(P)H-flavin reductase